MKALIIEIGYALYVVYDKDKADFLLDELIKLVFA